MTEVPDNNSNIHLFKDISNANNNELLQSISPGQHRGRNISPDIDLPKMSPVVDEGREESEKDYPKIVDLRKEDRTRISKLIHQIVRCRAKNEEDSQLINKLETDNLRLSRKVEALHNEVTSLKTNKFDEEYSSKISELTKLKNEMESKNKFIDERVNQMSRELRNLRVTLEQNNLQRKRIECKYATVKSKLKQALNTIKRFGLLEKEYPSLNEKLHVKTVKYTSYMKSDVEEKARVRKSTYNKEKCAVISNEIEQLETRWLSDLFFSNQPSTSEDEPY